jgi:hypothetical protein
MKILLYVQRLGTVRDVRPRASIGASIRSGFGVSRLHCSSCYSIGILALSKLAGPVELHFIQPMPSSKAYE